MVSSCSRFWDAMCCKAREEDGDEKKLPVSPPAEQSGKDSSSANAGGVVQKEPPKPAKTILKRFSDVNERTSRFIKNFYAQQKNEAHLSSSKDNNSPS
eukprot:TRINITY_DN567_c0_g1_i1.p1 TRINITY_DN567_c0_g1~~TRINITY_DN567_c0_g1_i1.p1  ORF type:complete len:107 (-),score=32.67 TRINITY_DN567_c0_g1_i1:157-450(-)